MKNNNDPALTYTLDQFVAMQTSDDLTYYNFSILEVVDGVEHLNVNLVEEYIDILKDRSLFYELTDEEYAKYKYNPDLLAHFLYGSVQLDFIILLLNDIYDPKEFTNRKIRLVKPTVLSEFLSAVYSKDYGWIQQNRSDFKLLV